MHAIHISYSAELFYSRNVVMIMNVIAIINTASGSVPEDGLEVLQVELSTRTNINCLGCYNFEPTRIAHLLESFKGQDIDCIIVWGGDGTVACVANELHATNIPILPLPGGTMNLLHKNIHGSDSDWKACLDALAQPSKSYKLRPGKLDGRFFYVAAMFGPLTQLADVRESVREKSPLQAASKLLQSDALDMRSQVQFRLNGEDNGQAKTAVALAAFVGDEPTAPLKVGVIDPDSLFDLSTVGLDALYSGWEEAEQIDRYLVQSLSVTHITGETLPYTLDGEQYETDQTIEVGLADAPIKFLSLRHAPCA